MPKLYKSKFYNKPIEVENIEGEKLVIIRDNFGRDAIYSWYDIEEQNTESFYINKCLLGGFVKKIPESVLIIGFGAGAFGKYLEDHIENIKISGIEIDKSMIDIAIKEFKIKTKDIYISDTDIALGKIIHKKEKYDLVLIDVYGSDGEIPAYFSTDSFFEKLKEVLIENGVISINYSNYNSRDENRLKKYERIHSNFLKYFGDYYSFLIEGTKDKGNKVGIYNLDKEYKQSDFEDNYFKNVADNKIRHDDNLITDFKTTKN